MPIIAEMLSSMPVSHRPRTRAGHREQRHRQDRRARRGSSRRGTAAARTPARSPPAITIGQPAERLLLLLVQPAELEVHALRQQARAGQHLLDVADRGTEVAPADAPGDRDHALEIVAGDLGLARAPGCSVATRDERKHVAVARRGSAARRAASSRARALAGSRTRTPTIFGCLRAAGWRPCRPPRRSTCSVTRAGIDALERRLDRVDLHGQRIARRVDAV